MGKGARNRRIRREALEIATEHGQPGRFKTLARIYRRGVVELRRRQHPSTPKGHRVWRTERERMVVDPAGAASVDGRRFRDRLRGRQGN